MATRAKPSNADGTSKAFADGSPEYTVADKFGDGPGRRIGPITGRLNRYKSSVGSLNQGTGAEGGKNAPTNKDNI